MPISSPLFHEKAFSSNLEFTQFKTCDGRQRKEINEGMPSKHIYWGDQSIRLHYNSKHPALATVFLCNIWMLQLCSKILSMGGMNFNKAQRDKPL